LLRSLLVDTAPAAAYAGVAAGGSFLFFWDRGLVSSGTETFQKVVSLIISTSVVAWFLFVLLSLPLAVGRPGVRCVPLSDREAAAILGFTGRIIALGAASWIIGVSLYLSWVGEGLPRLLLVAVGLVICAISLRALGRMRSRFNGCQNVPQTGPVRRDRPDGDLERCTAVRLPTSRLATPIRAFCSSGTDGSNPVPSSGESMSHIDQAAAGREPRLWRGCAPLGRRRARGPG
jgi:hypothetical protein